MPILIKNGDVITKGALLRKYAVTIDKGKIVSIGKQASGRDVSVIDAKGCFVSPGFIDMHIHGEPEKISRNEPRHGTTSVVIAISCDRADRIYKEIDRIKRFVSRRDTGSNILGVHLEGPYISKERAGAQKKSSIRRPDSKELLGAIKKYGRILKVMTVAPEVDGVGRLINILKANSIVASIGHSDATFKETIESIKSGISYATHIFNGMRPLDRREPGAAGAVLLSENVTAEIILDLVHVHETMFRVLLNMKGPDRVVLVTDSIKALHTPGIKKSHGAYRFRDGKIAGSFLTMETALKNAVKCGGIALVDAVKLAATNPAKVLGIQRQKGSIKEGKDADITIFDKNYDVKLTMISGKVVYRKKGF